MKIGYFADGRWGALALEKLLETDVVSIAFVVLRHGSEDPTIGKIAASHDLPCFSHPNVNSSEFLSMIAEYDPDILVSMSFNQIFKSAILQVTPQGVINCHAGALPFYRGRNPLNWVLINGEESFGITVHYMDEGIDTGDIILQRHYPIAEEDDYATLLTRAEQACATILYDAVMSLHIGDAKRQKQSDIHPVGFYGSRRVAGDEWIDWKWESQRMVNFIRGIALPAPGARCMLGEQEVVFLKAKMIDKAPCYIGNPGEVVGGVKGEYMVIKTEDSTILVQEIAIVQEDGSLSVPFSPAYTIGTRFSAGEK